MLTLQHTFFKEAEEGFRAFIEKEEDNRTYEMESDCHDYEYWGTRGTHSWTDYHPNNWAATWTWECEGWDSDDVDDFFDWVEYNFSELRFVGDSDPQTFEVELSLLRHHGTIKVSLKTS